MKSLKFICRVKYIQDIDIHETTQILVKKDLTDIHLM